MRFSRRTYLDWASAAPVSPASMRAFQRALGHFGNPSAPHEEGREARALVEEARTAIARLFEVKADAIVFTSGATEANTLALQGAVRAALQKGKPVHLLYLPTGHASSRKTIEALAGEGVSVEPLRLTDGAIDIAHFKTQVRPETLLVSVDAVCGETGARYDSRALKRALGEIKREDVLVHVDASQLPLVEQVTRARLKADLITLDAQKVGGVRGVGILVAPRNIELIPIVQGGGQERGLRSGTEPSALIAAFAAALAECAAKAQAFGARALRARASLLSSLSGIDGLIVNEGKSQAPHILNVSLLGRDTDYLVALLNERGFAVSTRSACETDAEGSHVVLAMTGNEEHAASTLRVSFGPSTGESDLIRFARALRESVEFLDRSAP